jgi:hypothetical protein
VRLSDHRSSELSAHEEQATAAAAQPRQAASAQHSSSAAAAAARLARAIAPCERRSGMMAQQAGPLASSALHNTRIFVLPSPRR